MPSGANLASGWGHLVALWLGANWLLLVFLALRPCYCMCRPSTFLDYIGRVRAISSLFGQKVHFFAGRGQPPLSAGFSLIIKDLRRIGRLRGRIPPHFAPVAG